MSIPRTSPSFRQSPPLLTHPYLSDPFLESLLIWLLPADYFTSIRPDLIAFGQFIVQPFPDSSECQNSDDVLNSDSLCTPNFPISSNSDSIDSFSSLHSLGLSIDRTKPVLLQFDAWGARIDSIVVSSAWSRLKAVAAKEGLVAIAYESEKPEWNKFRRVRQFAKLFMFNPSSGMVSCPVAMTDGAAKFLKEEVLRRSEMKHADVELSESFRNLENAYRRLISKDPRVFWMSGQWMTERGSGSDVSGGTCTVAKKIEGDVYELSGYKWFTSASDADMALALARIGPSGSSGPLSCFFLEMRNPNGVLNGSKIVRLKDKLGTRGLATAEMELVNTRAILCSQKDRGVPAISVMVNITRLHNAISACGYMRRITNLVRDYSNRREVFGKLLSKHALHLETLAAMELNSRAALIFTMHAVALLGDEENSNNREASLLLRILTPLVKLFTAKLCVANVSEGMECFGGVGYCEDSNIPVILRDSQVLPIWEGTTNVLSFDVLRVLNNGPDALDGFAKAVVENLSGGLFAQKYLRDHVRQELSTLLKFVQNHLKSKSEKSFDSQLEARARELSFALSRIYIASLFFRFAAFTGQDIDFHVAERWIFEQPLISNFLISGQNRDSLTSALALNLDDRQHPRFVASPKLVAKF